MTEKQSIEISEEDINLEEIKLPDLIRADGGDYYVGNDVRVYSDTEEKNKTNFDKAKVLTQKAADIIVQLREIYKNPPTNIDDDILKKALKDGIVALHSLEKDIAKLDMDMSPLVNVFSDAIFKINDFKSAALLAYDAWGFEPYEREDAFEPLVATKAQEQAEEEKRKIKEQEATEQREKAEKLNEHKQTDEYKAKASLAGDNIKVFGDAQRFEKHMMDWAAGMKESDSAIIPDSADRNAIRDVVSSLNSIMMINSNDTQGFLTPEQQNLFDLCQITMNHIESDFVIPENNEEAIRQNPVSVRRDPLKALQLIKEELTDGLAGLDESSQKQVQESIAILDKRINHLIKYNANSTPSTPKTNLWQRFKEFIKPATQAISAAFKGFTDKLPSAKSKGINKKMDAADKANTSEPNPSLGGAKNVTKAGRAIDRLISWGKEKLGIEMPEPVKHESVNRDENPPKNIDELLASPRDLAQFHQHTKNEFASENVEFLMAVMELKSKSDKGEPPTEEEVNSILTQYIGSEALQELNLSSEVTKSGNIKSDLNTKIGMLNQAFIEIKKMVAMDKLGSYITADKQKLRDAMVKDPEPDRNYTFSADAIIDDENKLFTNLSTVETLERVKGLSETEDDVYSGISQSEDQDLDNIQDLPPIPFKRTKDEQELDDLLDEVKVDPNTPKVSQDELDELFADPEIYPQKVAHEAKEEVITQDNIGIDMSMFEGTEQQEQVVTTTPPTIDSAVQLLEDYGDAKFNNKQEAELFFELAKKIDNKMGDLVGGHPTNTKDIEKLQQIKANYIDAFLTDTQFGPNQFHDEDLFLELDFVGVKLDDLQKRIEASVPKDDLLDLSNFEQEAENIINPQMDDEFKPSATVTFSGGPKKNSPSESNSPSFEDALAQLDSALEDEAVKSLDLDGEREKREATSSPEGEKEAKKVKPGKI